MARTRLNLDTYIPGLLTHVTTKLSSGASTVYRRAFGIGVTEWRVIAILAIEPGISASRICQVSGSDKALVSRTIQILEKQKYVIVHSVGEDSRRGAVTLTAAGLDLHDRVIKVALEREKLLLQDLNEKEIALVAKLLRRMHSRVEMVNGYVPKVSKAERLAKMDQTSDKPPPAISRAKGTADVKNGELSKAATLNPTSSRRLVLADDRD
jgi:DNA-binding MarR family transcriptional regulator